MSGVQKRFFIEIGIFALPSSWLKKTMPAILILKNGVEHYLRKQPESPFM
jgi:hypothetical protein